MFALYWGSETMLSLKWSKKIALRDDWAARWPADCLCHGFRHNSHHNPHHCCLPPPHHILGQVCSPSCDNSKTFKTCKFPPRKNLPARQIFSLQVKFSMQAKFFFACKIFLAGKIFLCRQNFPCRQPARHPSCLQAVPTQPKLGKLHHQLQKLVRGRVFQNAGKILTFMRFGTP